MYNQGKSCLRRIDKVIKRLGENSITDDDKRAAAVILADYVQEYAEIFKVVEIDNSTYKIMESKMNNEEL